MTPWLPPGHATLRPFFVLVTPGAAVPAPASAAEGEFPVDWQTLIGLADPWLGVLAQLLVCTLFFLSVWRRCQLRPGFARPRIGIRGSIGWHALHGVKGVGPWQGSHALHSVQGVPPAADRATAGLITLRCARRGPRQPARRRPASGRGKWPPCPPRSRSDLPTASGNTGTSHRHESDRRGSHLHAGTATLTRHSNRAGQQRSPTCRPRTTAADRGFLPAGSSCASSPALRIPGSPTRARLPDPGRRHGLAAVDASPARPVSRACSPPRRHAAASAPHAAASVDLLSVESPHRRNGRPQVVGFLMACYPWPLAGSPTAPPASTLSAAWPRRCCFGLPRPRRSAWRFPPGPRPPCLGAAWSR
jgi:hypothetical protein